MRAGRILVLGLVGVVGFAVGCKTNSVDKGAFKSAIDDYYKTRQVCLWTAPVKFPAQADTRTTNRPKPTTHEYYSCKSEITEGAWAFRPMKEAESLRAFRPGPSRFCGP